jgi:hypothetical protein
MKQLHEHKPSRHSFIAGTLVRLSKRVPPRNAAPGSYKVIAQLPERDGQLQYRVKSGYEPFYRTVTENELESDARANVTSRTASPFSASSPGMLQLGFRIPRSDDPTPHFLRRSPSK